MERLGNIPGEGSRRPTILVVDDDTDVREVTELVLETEGYRVLGAGTGEEAVEMACKLLPGGVDLVVTDIRMPRMDGREVARALHERAPELPILFITGYTGGVTSEDVEVTGSEPLLTKPFEMQELLARVRSMLPPSHEYAH